MKNIIDDLNDDQFAEIINTSVCWKDLQLKFGYKNSISSNIKEKIRKRCEILDLTLNVKVISTLLTENRTKGDLFNNRMTWQSARSTIRKNACNVFEKSKKEYRCALCGYDKHIEIAHIKSVSDFDNSAEIKEINHIDNLIGLCPNHHWEYDAGLINL